MTRLYYLFESGNYDHWNIYNTDGIGRMDDPLENEPGIFGESQSLYICGQRRYAELLIITALISETAFGKWTRDTLGEPETLDQQAHS